MEWQLVKHDRFKTRRLIPLSAVSIAIRLLRFSFNPFTVCVRSTEYSNLHPTLTPRRRRTGVILLVYAIEGNGFQVSHPAQQQGSSPENLASTWKMDFSILSAHHAWPCS